MSMKKSRTLIFGRHPVLDAIKAGKTIQKVIMQQGFRGPLEKEIRNICKVHAIPFQFLPKERIEYLVSGNHQGVIAYLSPIDFQQLEDILPFVYEQSQIPLFLLLDGVTDVRNFGAIARTAEVMGAHAIVVPRKKSAQINADAIKTSAGALMKIPVCREASIIATIEMLQQSGVQVFASDLYASNSIVEMDFKGPTALVIGAEDRGVSPSILKEVDQTFIIPQYGETDSLNVSVATGMMLYEVIRQRL